MREVNIVSCSIMGIALPIVPVFSLKMLVERLIIVLSPIAASIWNGIR